MSTTYAYVDIGCAIVSMMACSIICILGLISPIYRKYPSKIIVWISIQFILLGIFIIFDQIIVIIHKSQSDELIEAQKITKFLLSSFIILISNQLILFLNEVMICIYNPFQATSSSVFLFLLGMQIFLLFFLLIIPLLFIDHIKELSRLASLINFINIFICVIFYLALGIMLKKNKKLQSKTLYFFKVKFVVFQFYWISTMLIIFGFFSAINLDDYQGTVPYPLNILLSLQGLVFAIFHIMQPYSYQKLKLFFFGSCSSELEAKELYNIEFGFDTDLQNKYIPKYEKLLKTQVNELVKGLVKAVHTTLTQQFDHHFDEFEIKRIYTFKFHLLEMDESRMSQSEGDIMKDSIILIKSYYPNQFMQLMKQSNFTKQQIEFTLDLLYNEKAFEKAKESMGRSGAFFFFSQNNRLILKTVEKSEIQDFLDGRAMPYFTHLGHNPHSLIAKIYGLFKIKLMAYKTQYLILMENSFEDIKLLECKMTVFDLKGSKINRTSKSNDSVLKDNNFIQSFDYPIHLLQPVREKILNQIRSDCQFLRDIGYMDYSLLIGICEGNFTIDNSSYKLLTNIKNDKAYSISLIDYMQRFNSYKRQEQWFKRYVKMNKKSDLSCRSPVPYCERFISFADSIFV